MANKFNSLIVNNEELDTKRFDKEDKIEQYGLAFNFTSNDNNKNVDLTVNEDSLDNAVVQVKEDIVIKNKDIIINNAFALADKKMKISLLYIRHKLP